MKKIVIYSPYKNPKPSQAHHYDPRRYRNEYREVVGDDGLLRLEVCGTYDSYEQIQQCRDVVDIYHIVSRARNGDPSGLQARPAVYGDLDGLPNDMSGAFRSIESARRVFDQLPIEVKKFYHNDFINFMSRFDGVNVQSVPVANNNDLKDDDNNDAS